MRRAVAVGAAGAVGATAGRRRQRQDGGGEGRRKTLDCKLQQLLELVSLCALYCE